VVIVVKIIWVFAVGVLKLDLAVVYNAGERKHLRLKFLQ